MPAPPSLAANFPWAVLTQSLLHAAPGAVFFPIMHCCRLLLPKTPLNFLSFIGSAVSLAGAVKTSTLEIDCAFTQQLSLRRELNEMCMPDAGQLICFCFCFFYLHWIDRAITRRWKELVGWELQLPGWIAVNEKRYTRCILWAVLHINHHCCMETGCKWRCPSVTWAGYVHTGCAVFKANLASWPIVQYFKWCFSFGTKSTALPVPVNAVNNPYSMIVSLFDTLVTDIKGLLLITSMVFKTCLHRL